MKIELDLNPQEYQQLVECFYAGSLVLEDLYPISEASFQLADKIHIQAQAMGREDLVSRGSETGGYCTVSRKVEQRVAPLVYP